MLSAHQTTEYVFYANAECQHGCDMCWRASAQGAGNFYGGAGFTALGECNGVGSSLVGASLPRGAFGGVEGCRSRTLSGLLPELRVADAGLSNELHQLESELIGNELMMRRLTGGRWRERHAPLPRADGVPAPRSREP
jgi:hypothetical protein